MLDIYVEATREGESASTAVSRTRVSAAPLVAYLPRQVMSALGKTMEAYHFFSQSKSGRLKP